jgi:hypothetical protein
MGDADTFPPDPDASCCTPSPHQSRIAATLPRPPTSSRPTLQPTPSIPAGQAPETAARHAADRTMISAAAAEDDLQAKSTCPLLPRLPFPVSARILLGTRIARPHTQFTTTLLSDDCPKPPNSLPTRNFLEGHTLGRDLFSTTTWPSVHQLDRKLATGLTSCFRGTREGRRRSTRGVMAVSMSRALLQRQIAASAKASLRPASPFLVSRRPGRQLVQWGARQLLVGLRGQHHSVAVAGRRRFSTSNEDIASQLMSIPEVIGSSSLPRDACSTTCACLVSQVCLASCRAPRAPVEGSLFTPPGLFFAAPWNLMG